MTEIPKPKRKAPSKAGTTNKGPARLTEDQKTFIVTKLAQYCPSSMIVRQFHEAWPDTAISPQLVYQHRPEGAQGKDLAKKWIVLHEIVRKAFMEDVSRIPIADKVVRMGQYQELYDGLFAMGDLAEAAKVLEKAAKEMGGLFTNERKVEHDGTITHEAAPTMDDLRMMLADRLRPAIDAATKH